MSNWTITIYLKIFSSPNSSVWLSLSQIKCLYVSLFGLSSVLFYNCISFYIYQSFYCYNFLLTIVILWCKLSHAVLQDSWLFWPFLFTYLLVFTYFKNMLSFFVLICWWRERKKGVKRNNREKNSQIISKAGFKNI